MQEIKPLADMNAHLVLAITEKNSIGYLSDALAIRQRRARGLAGKIY